MASFPLQTEPGLFHLGIGIEVAQRRFFASLKGFSTFGAVVALRKRCRTAARAVQSDPASALTAEPGVGKRCLFAVGTTHGDTLQQAAVACSMRQR